jgi:hypothetical protein
MDKIKIDFNPQPTEPLRPELLVHPPIPRYLHGVNPRTIKGQDWWDSVRHPVYRKSNWCCWACGSNDGINAHESYEYDQEHYVARLAEVVALCHDCHRFVHSFMTYSNWLHGGIKFNELERILHRGRDILTRAGLKPHILTRSLIYAIDDKSRKDVFTIAAEESGNDRKQLRAFMLSRKWRLVFEGEEYDYDTDIIAGARHQRKMERMGWHVR